MIGLHGAGKPANLPESGFPSISLPRHRRLLAPPVAALKDYGDLGDYSKIVYYGVPMVWTSFQMSNASD